MRERGRAGKGGERRLYQGLQELPHSQFVHTLVLTGKISWLPLKQCRGSGGKRRPQRAVWSVTASQLLLTPVSGLHRVTIIQALPFQSRFVTPGQIIPLTGKLRFEGKKRELLFAILPPISYGRGRVYGLARDPGYPQRMLCCCITVRTPLFSSSWYQQQH